MVMDPGQVRRIQAAHRHIAEVSALREELLATKMALLESRQHERALQTQLLQMEAAVSMHDDSDFRRAVLDLADRDRDLRILRRQVAAALAALQTYAKQDERRKVERSVAAATLKHLREDIPREEDYDRD